MNEKIRPPTEERIIFLRSEIIEKAADAIRKYDTTKPVSLVYHNDTDGLCSAVLVSKAIEKIGRTVKFYAAEQIYPHPLSQLYELAQGPVVFVDLGISHKYEDFIRKKTGERPTIIIDHHESQEKSLPALGQDNVFDLNCTKYDIDGDHYSSASTMAYLFASKLANIIDYAHLGVLGAYGDKNHMKGEEPGQFHSQGLDFIVLELSQNIRYDDGIYSIKLPGDSEYRLMTQIVHDANLLGSVGFRKKGNEFDIEGLPEKITGPGLGKMLLTQGYDDRIKQVLEKLNKRKNHAYEEIIGRLREGDFKKFDNIFFFDAKDAFKGMGVKTIGSFCEYLISERFRNNFNFMEFNQYIMGAQTIEPVRVGDTSINAFNVEDVLKVSIRTPPELRERIDANKSLSVADLLRMINPGQVGSSHRKRGATILPIEKVEQFLSHCQGYIKEGRPCTMSLPELEIDIES